MAKNLIIYYSRKGENYWDGRIVDLKKGNTERVAEFIQKAAGGELFEVETVKSYSTDYNKCTKEAQAELRTGERVEPKAYLDDLSGYDNIFVGFPNWWGTMPMVLFTFLEHYDLAGKTILPFCTNEGSGMGSSESDLRKICKGAEVKRGLSIRGCRAEQSEAQVEAWVRQSLQIERKIKAAAGEELAAACFFVDQGIRWERYSITRFRIISTYFLASSFSLLLFICS